MGYCSMNMILFLYRCISQSIKNIKNNLDLHDFFMHHTFSRVSPTCFARRKARKNLIYQKFAQIQVVLIIFPSNNNFTRERWKSTLLDGAGTRHFIFVSHKKPSLLFFFLLFKCMTVPPSWTINIPQKSEKSLFQIAIIKTTTILHCISREISLLQNHSFFIFISILENKINLPCF